MKNKQLLGHLAAMFTIFLWGSTFISTKYIINGFFSNRDFIFPFFYRVLGSDDHLSSHHEGAK